MYGIESDEDLFTYLERLKTTEAGVFVSVTAWECFKKLYGRSCELLAEDYNREEAFQGRERRYTGEEMSEGDLEKALCSAVPRDRHGNLSPAKASKLHAQFEGKRFSRQHINEILHRNAPVTRFDLITLNFYIFSRKLDEIPNPKKLFSEYISSTNAILESCSMDQLYVQNPYESFILMCLLSVDPLGTYGEVWEKSFSGNP